MDSREKNKKAKSGAYKDTRGFSTLINSFTAGGTSVRAHISSLTLP